MVIALRCQLWYFAFQTDPEDIFALFGRIIAIWCKIDHLQGLLPNSTGLEIVYQLPEGVNVLTGALLALPDPPFCLDER